MILTIIKYFKNKRTKIKKKRSILMLIMTKLNIYRICRRISTLKDDEYEV